MTSTRTVEEQLQRILADCKPLEPLELPVIEAGGCVLAEDVLTALPLPAFATVIGEGYAVRSADTASAGAGAAVRLAVADQVGAGYRSGQPLEASSAIRVAAGAMLPDGADAVVPVADTDGGLETVEISAKAAVGLGVRQVGEFAEAGQLAVSDGIALGPNQLAALVAAGRSRAFVHPVPRVVVITVGSELAEPAAPLRPGLIHDVNTVMLTSATLQAGAVAYRAGPVPDDPAVLATVMEGQLVRADLIVIAGGAGGVVEAAMNHLGRIDLARTAVEPGPVVGCGTMDDALPVFSLPGDPVSAMINYEIFVRPAIRRLMGHRHLFRPVVRARLLAGVTSTAGLRRFAPVAISGRDGEYVADPVPGQQALSLLATVSVNGLAVVPEETVSLNEGDEVLAIRLDEE